MESGSTEFCAMMLAKDNYAHNIPKEWITAKVWAVLLKNPVYKDYVKKNARFVTKNLQKADYECFFVTKILHQNILTSPKLFSILLYTMAGNSRKTKHSKRR